MDIVCVTGMHRSGTSLVSRVINLLGVDLGPEDDLMEAKPDNPRGFWESWSFTRLNEEALNALGGRWDEPPALEEGWERSERLNEVRASAVSLLETHFDSDGLVGWKDPRTSLTLPFWRTLAPIHRTVLCLRSPGEVAGSLLRRNGLDGEHAASLWLRYTIEAWLNDPYCLIVRYRDFFADADRVLKRLVEHLEIQEPDEQTRREIDEFLDADLFHASEQNVAMGPTMDVALAIEQLLISGDDEQLHSVLHGIRSGLRAQARVRGLTAELAAQSTRFEEQAARATAAVEGAMENMETSLQTLAADLEHERRWHREELARIREEARDERAALRQRLEAAATRADELARAIDALKGQNERLRRERDARVEEVMRLRSELAEFSAEVRRLERARTAVQAKLDEVYASDTQRGLLKVPRMLKSSGS